jgi:RNA polymerase sigma-70 factor (ECF subfamily)
LSTGIPTAGQYSAVTSVARLPIVSAASAGEPGDAAPSVELPPLPPFARLYDEHFDFVWREACRLGVPGASVEDVVQDTFLVLHRRLGDYDGRTPVKGWLLGIVYRVVSDHRRRFRRKDAACVPHAADSDGNVLLASPQKSPSAEAEHAEQVRLLEDLLAEMDEEKRELLVLSELEEMTVPEIAEMRGANVNTIYARLRAARKEFEAAYARRRAREAHGRRTP